MLLAWGYHRVMKRIALATLLLAQVLAWAAKPAPNPADYTITVHVQSSRLTKGILRPVLWAQHLTVSIDGKKYELEGGYNLEDVVRVGDYKAKIAKDETKQAYEYRREYEFLFADGITREYYVVGEGE